MSTPINRRKYLSRTAQTAGVAFSMQSFVAEALWRLPEMVGGEGEDVITREELCH